MKGGRSHNITIHNITVHNKRKRSGGIDLDEGLYITSQYKTEQYITRDSEFMELTLMKGGTSHRIRSYDTGWWRREVVTMGGGDDGKW